ncbi:hypothetical protein FJ366_01860 [Candidatus Dependentiae bacterium]|nr:hypothetical protein [Candidatus Dependentiae bacterium]
MFLKKITLFGLFFSAAFVFSPDTPGRRGAPNPATPPVTPPRVIRPDEFVFQTPAGQVLTEDEVERRGPPPVR